MNKILNRRLNIIELVALAISCVCVSISLNISINGISQDILKYLLLTIGLILEIIIISIELALFIVLNKKNRYYYLGYLLINLILFIGLTKLIPFGGIISILPLSALKFIYRTLYVKEIYDEKTFKRYCRMFNIKLPKQKKTKVVKTTKKKTIQKKQTKTTRNPQKSYA